jgi:hypothetical protein
MPLIMGNISQLLSLYPYHCNNGPERFHYKKKTHAVLAIKGEKKDETRGRRYEAEGGEKKRREGRTRQQKQKNSGKRV